jgi:hypothetical protein
VLDMVVELYCLECFDDGSDGRTLAFWGLRKSR